MKLSYLYTILIIIFSLITFFSINHIPTSQKQHNDLIQEKELRLSNLRQLTFSGENAEAYFSNNGDSLIFHGAANFGPYFFPSGNKIIFSSNLHDPKGRDFDLYSINIDGSGLERITFFNGFDGFPMFSPNGKHIVFASNRNQKKKGDTNLFLAEWNYK